ncbi:nitrile hydratase accessory protein [Sulfitobacter sp. EhC04]|uniref:nitrile hydratase accessory protein n=1 Tax=Sulfitobacter sp. EhC04 TaxID=1849168 RepID=UPI0007F4B1D4|nr:nitrile hydratase accessory protein [Sulfitobacter sp. EhC04]OAN74408.1 nitrile hydratase accessory protein [Sulfitobacter sp. EhC04]
MTRPEPAFEALWHAQVFALTVHLNEIGQFTWGDWAARFGATLRRHGLARELNGGEDYFAAWLETLEGVLAETGLADSGDVTALRDAWEAAYLRTPHGAPVRLDDAAG